ncbi:N-acyl homoserine lactonase family protein [Glaciihabitans sp. UYNi722]|uniref:N-acyl homoserine lactonase family protein n=1 Tax=Glaciihabitans sp. UYNi722 TaxID=3156344 RepID=UPI0033988021
MAVTYELTPLITGWFTAFPVDKFVLGWPRTEAVRAPCIAWLGRGSDGSNVLVDTGPAAPTFTTAAIHFPLEVRPEHRIDRAIRAAGVDPDSIIDVVLSHLHYDHSGNGEHLVNARFWVQEEEVRYAIAPDTQHLGGYEVGFDGVIPAWLGIFDRLHRVAGDIEVASGCTVLHLPGHSPGSAGVVFETVHGRVAVAGDLVSRLENWTALGGGHAACTLNSDEEECASSFQRLENSADFVLASHDLRGLPKFINAPNVE